MKDREIEDTILELESRVAKLECQKEALQNKLSMAKQHIMDLGGSTPFRIGKGPCESLRERISQQSSLSLMAFFFFFFWSGKCMEVEVGVRRATQTAPPHYRSVLEDTRMEMERL